MDFTNFTIETKKNPSQLIEQPIKSSTTKIKSSSKKTSSSKKRSNTTVNSSIRHDRRSFNPSADYSMFKKVYQTCEQCNTEVLHIINKAGNKVRCTDCNFTYLI